MFDKIADVLPKSLVFGVFIAATVAYTFTGPELAARVIRADHMPKCEAGYSETIRRQADEAIRSIPQPTADLQKEKAAERLRSLQNSPLAVLMKSHPIAQHGMGQMSDALEVYEAEKRAAKAAYDEAVRRVKDMTHTHLGKAGNYCGCLADAAIGEARYEFALWAGTFGLHRPAKVRDLDALLAQQQVKGACSGLRPGG